MLNAGQLAGLDAHVARRGTRWGEILDGVTAHEPLCDIEQVHRPALTLAEAGLATE